MARSSAPRGGSSPKRAYCPANPRVAFRMARLCPPESRESTRHSDLALLSVPATDLKPVRWADDFDPPVGTLLAAIGTEQPLAVGVVSVPRRDLESPVLRPTRCRYDYPPASPYSTERQNRRVVSRCASRSAYHERVAIVFERRRFGLFSRHTTGRFSLLSQRPLDRGRSRHPGSGKSPMERETMVRSVSKGGKDDGSISSPWDRIRMVTRTTTGQTTFPR